MGEIEFPVQECAAGELSVSSEAGSSLEHCSECQFRNCGSAVAVKFDEVLASVAVGRVKGDGEAAVDGVGGG